jgi:hypothetical protein
MQLEDVVDTSSMPLPERAEGPRSGDVVASAA